jgi:hypothetical protein
VAVSLRRHRDRCCEHPRRPTIAAAFPSRIDQTDPTGYRNRDQMSNGRVLAIGAPGAQIADELSRSGRE